MYRLPDISGETELVRSMLTDDREGPEIAKDYGVDTKLLNERMRHQRTFWLDMDNMSNEELADAINTIGGTIDKQARWFKLKPKVFRSNVFKKLMSDDEFIKAYSEQNFLPEDFSEFIGIPEFITRETMKRRAIRLKARRSKEFNPSMMKRRFYDYPERKQEAQEKREATMMERYGVRVPLKDVDLQLKAHSTFKERYGVGRLLSSKKERNFISLIKRTLSDVHTYKENTRLKAIKGREFDLLIDDKFALEFNGSYWHSIEVKGDKDGYHINKFIGAKGVGITLMSIWESEWDNKELRENIVENIVRLVEPDRFSKINIDKLELSSASKDTTNLMLDDYIVARVTYSGDTVTGIILSDGLLLEGSVGNLLKKLGMSKILFSNDRGNYTGLSNSDVKLDKVYTEVVTNYLNSGFDVEPSGWTLYTLD